MEDLMTGTYNTEELRRDNGGFMVPDFSIEIEGKQIRRSSKSGTLFIDSVCLKLSADAAGSLTFDVLNAYDQEARKFTDGISITRQMENYISRTLAQEGSILQKTRRQPLS